MQTLAQIVYSEDESLRDPIVNDRPLPDFGVVVQKE